MTDVDELTKIAGIAAKKFILRNGGDFDDARSEVVVFLLSLDAPDLADRRAYYIKAGVNRLATLRRKERRSRCKAPPQFVEFSDAVGDGDVLTDVLKNERRRAIERVLATFGADNRWRRKADVIEKHRRRDREIIQKWLDNKTQTALGKEYGVSKQRINQIVQKFRKACRRTV